MSSREDLQERGPGQGHGRHGRLEVARGQRAGAERERGQERDLLGHQEGGCVYSECDGQRLAGWSHRVLIWPTIQSHSSCLEELRSFPRDLRAGESPTFASDHPSADGEGNSCEEELLLKRRHRSHPRRPSCLPALPFSRTGNGSVHQTW